MTQPKKHFFHRTKTGIASLNCLISIGISLGLLGCSHPSSILPTEAQPPQVSVADVTSSSNMIPSPEPEAASSLAQQLPLTAMITINGTTINLEVANTPVQQAIGLMHRTSLRDDQGMLFPFTPPRPVNFWMRNVEINLDMLFIRDGKIVAVEADVPPCRTAICPQYGPPRVPVDYVLELRGGRTAELGAEIGDPIVITELPNTL